MAVRPLSDFLRIVSRAQRVRIARDTILPGAVGSLMITVSSGRRYTMLGRLLLPVFIDAAHDRPPAH